MSSKLNLTFNSTLLLPVLLTLTMPQGKKWSSEECEALAKAWINVSEDS
jgi:hypothetical protein